MTNVTQTHCPVPFLGQDDYPATGGFIDGRVCATIQLLGNISCCLPCPYQNLVYTDAFPGQLRAASWVSLPALILQVFLLVTFLALPENDGHGNYLNYGMVISVIVLELCFIVSLAAPNDLCYDPITPNDMGSSMGCAWSGALLLAGAMATIAWILVRSLHTHLRVVWTIELPRWYKYIEHAIGWGLPAIFLAISLPITGVSYQFGTLCYPKQRGMSANWVGWYLAFSGLAVVLQLGTTIYCVYMYAASFQHDTHQSSTVDTQISSSSGLEKQAPRSGMYKKKRSWRRLKQILLLQWRSIVLSLLVAFGAIYFGIVYVTTADIRKQQLTPSNYDVGWEWVYCLASTRGDKHPCMGYAEQLGLNEAGAVASLTLVAMTGIGTFFLLLRRSMISGWYQVLHDPKQYWRDIRRRKTSIDEAFVIATPQTARADKQTTSTIERPEPGDATQRHETTTIFDEDANELTPSDIHHHTVFDEHIERV